MPDHSPMILLASADARGELPELHQEVSHLDSLFQGLRDRGLDYRHLPYARLEGIKDALDEHRHRIAIFHYAGHADEGRLMLEAALGSADGLVHAEGLAGLLGAQRGLKLVFLNGCSTLPQVDLLLGAGVPVVIATSRAVNDAVARDFAVAFYEALTVGREADGIRKGQSIAEAFASAENFVKAKHTAAPEALYRDLTVKSQDIREVTKGLPWLLRPSSGAPALRWGLFEDEPLFGLPRLPEGLPTPQVPVRRLEWFRRDDARIFFGRGRAIRALYDAVTSRSGSPILLYYGATGVGKSSVLHAGLMPRLEADHDVKYVRREPLLGLLGSLREALAAGPDAELLGDWRACEQASGRPLVLILDQVEETFTRPLKSLTPADELAALAGAVRGLGLAADRPLGKLVLGFRKEWLQEVEQALAAVAVTEDMIAKVPLDPMDGKDIREAVAGPARDPDLRDLRLEVDDDIPGLIAHDLLSDEDARAAVAPTLQVILSQLWDQVKDRRPRRYTVDLYHALQGEGLLLRDFLKKQLEILATTHPAEVEKGFDLEVLEAHTTAWGTANRRSRSSLAGQFREQADRLIGLLQRFKDLYLLVDPPADPAAVKDPGAEPDPETSLAHDALAPLVQEKQRASSARAQRARRLLENRAGEWKAGREGTPLDAADLVIVESGLPWIRVPEPHEARLIEASREAESSRRVAEARRTARERSLARWRDRLAVAAGIGLLIASIAAWGFWDQLDAKVEANKNLGVQVTKTNEANQKLAAQIALVESEKKVAELRLQHSVLTQVAAFAQSDPVRSLELLLDPRVFPETDRDFAWGYHLGLCDWVRTIVAHEGAVRCVAGSADRQTLATGGNDGTLRFWEASTGEPKGRPIQAHRGGVTTVAFSPAGKTLATGGDDGRLRFWDASTAEPTGQPIAAHRGAVSALAYCIDDSTLATGSSDGTLRLWNASTGEPRGQPIAAHRGGVGSIADCMDGRTLATGGGDGRLRFWNALTGQPRGEPVEVHDRFDVMCMAYGLIGRALTVGTFDGWVEFWDATNLKSHGTIIFSTDHEVSCLDYSRDGSTLAAGGGDGMVRFWDARTRDPRGQPFLAHRGGVTSLTYTGIDRRMATVGYDGNLRIWLPDRWEPKGRAIPSFQQPRSVAFSRDGWRLAVGDADGRLGFWYTLTGEPRRRPVAAHKGAVLTLAFSTDDQTLATGGADGTLRLWEALTGEPKGQPIRAHEGGVSSVAYSADGKTLATAGADGAIRFWAASTCEPSSPLIAAHEGGVSSITYRAESQSCATVGRDSRLRFWDAAAGQPQGQPITAHRGEVRIAAFNVDGKTLGTGAANGELRLWDGNTGEPKGPPILAHRGGVTAVSFSADGRTLATAGADGELRLWDATTAEPKGPPIRAHEGGVSCAAFSPDGRTLATGGTYEPLRLWTPKDPARKSESPAAVGSD